MVKLYILAVLFFMGINPVVANTLTVVPEFTSVPLICAGSVPPLLPSVSNNGISGTWSPSTINNTTSGTYVFTPAPGQDATSVTLNVTVTPEVMPLFPSQLTMMPCATPPPLQTTSPNGVTGTWSPPEISNTESGVYVFTPDAGQCASTATMTVNVNGLNLHCDPVASTPTGIMFDFNNVGQTEFEISYTIDGGLPVVFTQPAPSSYYVTIEPGQAVTMTVTANLSCLVSETITCASLGVEQNNKSKLSFYPNPVAELLTVEGEFGEAEIAVFNLIGQLIRSRSLNGSTGTIDLTGMLAGVYIVTVTSGDGAESFKIVKQ